MWMCSTTTLGWSPSDARTTLRSQRKRAPARKINYYCETLGLFNPGVVGFRECIRTRWARRSTTTTSDAPSGGFDRYHGLLGFVSHRGLAIPAVYSAQGRLRVRSNRPSGEKDRRYLGPSEG